MFFDILVLLMLVLALFKGWRNGLILGVFSFLAFILGLATAMKLSSVAAVYIGENVKVSEGWLPFIAFVAVFLIVVILVRLGAKAIESVIEVAQLGWLNKLGGICLYVLVYLFILSVILSYAEQWHLVYPETMTTSQTYQFIHPVGPAIINVVGIVIPVFKNMFAG